MKMVSYATCIRTSTMNVFNSLQLQDAGTDTVLYSISRGSNHFT